jgi:hypothetical protein
MGETAVKNDPQNKERAEMIQIGDKPIWDPINDLRVRSQESCFRARGNSEDYNDPEEQRQQLCPPPKKVSHSTLAPYASGVICEMPATSLRQRIKG